MVAKADLDRMYEACAADPIAREQINAYLALLKHNLEAINRRPLPLFSAREMRTRLRPAEVEHLQRWVNACIVSRQSAVLDFIYEDMRSLVIQLEDLRRRIREAAKGHHDRVTTQRGTM